MAVIFLESLPNNELLNAYNNQVVRFKSDTTTKTTAKAEVSGLGFSALLYPNPLGEFFFNFKEYFMGAVNTKNFADDTDFVINTADINTATYNVNEGHFVKGDVTIKVIFTDNTTESTTINHSILASVTQLNTFKNDKIIIDNYQFVPLIPSFNKLLTNLKVWRGYPFEFTGYASNPTNEISFRNDTYITGLSIFPQSELTAFYLTDGFNENPYLGLEKGWNQLSMESQGIELDNKLHIFFETEECGVYVKFLNRYGRWTYWLFDKNYFESRTSKYMGEIENDFYNINKTQSPTLQIGKISDGTIKVAAKRITPEFDVLLEDIFDSPKIMIFNGVRGQVSTYRDWFETRLKTTSFQVKSPNKKIKNYYLEFDNPQRNTITL